MMPPITNIDSNLPKSCLKHRMPSVSFHIICTLVEVPDSRNMVLPNNIALNKRIPKAIYRNWSSRTGALTFRCLPIMFPWFPIIIAVFQIVSPWLTSLSRIGLIMTMLYFWASSWRNCVDSPSTGSANSHHLFSRVQKANGIVHASLNMITWK